MKSKIFDFDSPLVHGILRIKDLFLLNAAAVICMLPVITFGPAMKALAFTCLKMVREEDGNVLKTFWKNFTMNFKQSVLFGLVCLLLLFIISGDIVALVLLRGVFPVPAIIAAAFVMTLCVMVLLFAVPMQGRFLNKITDTFKNAFWASVIKFPKTMLMLLSWFLIPVLYVFVSQNFLPLLLTFGLSLPSYLNAVIYEPFFKQMEERIEQADRTAQREGERATPSQM